MAELTTADHKVRKAVGEAEEALKKLAKEIKGAITNIQLGRLDKRKILAANKKVVAVMNRFTPITRIQQSGLQDQLAPSSRAYVDWMDRLMSNLLNLSGDLRKAAAMTDKDPAKNLKTLISTSRTYSARRRRVCARSSSRSRRISAPIARASAGCR